MARKPKRERKSPSPPPPRGTSDRDKAVDALMALLAEQSFEQIGLAEVAGRAGIEAVATARRIRLDARHPGRAHQRDRPRRAGRRRCRYDRRAGARAAFDVLMRRLEALAPYKDAVRSVMRSARRNPGLCFALNAMALRSQNWMLEAAGIGASGPKGALRAQGAALMFARVLGVWVDDDEPALRPHHGGARPRPRQRRTLGRFPRRSVRIPGAICRGPRRRRRDRKRPTRLSGTRQRVTRPTRF